MQDHQSRRDYEFIQRIKPLETRPYRMKKPALRFFCPLCRTERSISTRPRLSGWNYFQIALSSIFFFVVLFPFMEWNSFYLSFIIWIGAEAAVRMRFKKEIPCPHCGFDATWYKRDVKVARKLVNNFWEKQSEPVVETGATQQEVPIQNRESSESRLDQAGFF